MAARIAAEDVADPTLAAESAARVDAMLRKIDPEAAADGAHRAWHKAKGLSWALALTPPAGMPAAAISDWFRRQRPKEIWGNEWEHLISNNPHWIAAARELNAEAEKRAAAERERRAQAPVLPTNQPPKPTTPKKRIRQSDGSWPTYRGSKRDRSGDPYWDQTPTNVRVAVADGRLKAVDMSVAGVIYRHIRKSARYRDKGKRIARPEIARLLGLSVKTVGESIARMVAAGELIVISPGKWNLNGAIYGFPARKRV